MTDPPTVQLENRANKMVFERERERERERDLTTSLFKSKGRGVRHTDRQTTKGTSIDNSEKIDYY